MASSKEGFLDGAYEVEDGATTRDLYRDWAASYEAEVRANGYVTPERCAAALAEAVEDRSLPLLDLGCGTGLSGEALKAAGFATLDGSDFSREMLAFAGKKQGLYRDLVLGDLTTPLPGKPGDYNAAAAIGVFSPGHAPPAMIEQVLDLLLPGGCFVFSLNDHAREDPDYEREIERLVEAGKAAVVFNRNGPHLPARNIEAVVCVLRRL